MNWRSWKAWAWSGFIWVSVSIVWTPAVILIGPSGSLRPEIVAGAIIMLLFNFLPWALSAPLFHWLSRLFPIGLGQSLLSMSFFLAFSLLFVPLVTAVGFGANQLFLILIGAGSDAGMIQTRMIQAIFINGLFAFPTYVAMTAIGQTLAFIERYREHEQSLAEAREEAIQSQLAPHFLFNALNVVSELEHTDPERRDDAIVWLSRLLRQTLERPAITPLHEEIAYIEDFIGLHRLVLEDRLKVEISVSPTASEQACPSLVLQPILENAIGHGIARLPEGGTVRIEASEAAARVRIIVTNDAPSERPSSCGSGRGLRIVRHRLEAVYGDDARLEFRRHERRAVTIVDFPTRPLS